MSNYLNLMSSLLTKPNTLSKHFALLFVKQIFGEKLCQHLSKSFLCGHHQHHRHHHRASHSQPQSTPTDLNSSHFFLNKICFSKLDSGQSRYYPSTSNFDFVSRTRFPHFHQERCCHSWSLNINNANVSGAVAHLKEKFVREDIPESDVTAEYIVAHALGIKRLSEFSRIDQQRVLSAEEQARMTEFASQKLSRIPLQYIIGEWDFRDLTLKMKPPVFIPRPETEMLVDLLVSHYPEDAELDILEVGCGTGAIGLSLLSEFERAHVTAIDASRDAVELTQENATRLGLSNRLNVNHTALIEGSPLDVHPKKGPRYDVIVSNPPYLFTTEMDDLDPEILRNEDPIALEAGAEGLDVIKTIIKHAGQLLTPHGLIWLETDTRHHRMIEDWLSAHPETCVQFKRSYLDFTDRTRFCQLEYVP